MSKDFEERLLKELREIKEELRERLKDIELTIDRKTISYV